MPLRHRLGGGGIRGRLGRTVAPTPGKKKDKNDEARQTTNEHRERGEE
jgi:hypothetical protein